LLIFLFSASFQSAGDPAQAAVSGLDRGGEGPLELSCDVNPVEVRRGETVSWNVTLCNPGPGTVKNVFLEVDFDGHIEPVAASMMPSEAGVWRFEEMEAGSCRKIELVARVPEQDRSFVMSRSISGEGFVSLTEDYTTGKEPYEIRCDVSAWIEGMNEPVKNSTVVAVLGEAGAEVRVRETGSGNYSSTEMVRVDKGNGSIEVFRNVSAEHSPFNLSLGENRSANYTTPWVEMFYVRNWISGNFTNQSKRNATVLDHWSYAKLDENGTVFMSGEG